MSGAQVTLQDVRLSLGATDFRFDTHIDAGEIVAVIGPSGAGKSTLLNLIAGFETPDSGRIEIDSVEITEQPPHRRPVTMIFQENNLFGHLDVAANIGLGRSSSLRLSATDRGRIDQAMARTGLAGKQKRLPAELSGGERQRVALARALVRDRPVLLADEPFASLGPALRRDMLELMGALHAEQAMTIIMVSHHPDDIRDFADRVVFVEAGSIGADGPAATLLGDRPPAKIARYLGLDEEK